MRLDILVVDDEADIRQQIEGILSDEGYEPRSVGTALDALQAVKACVPTLVLLDIWLNSNENSGLEVLATFKKEHPSLPVVMMSGHGNIEMAVSCLKKGAYDYIEKPFKAERLLLVVKNALEAERLRRENSSLKQRGGQEGEMIGHAPSLQKLRNDIEKVAPANSRVVFTGATGVGKETAARLLHDRSARAKYPFVVASCALITPDRLELELFGCEAGHLGSTGKVGLLEQAHKGTLLLDEVADMPRETQGKILRLLLEQKFTRLGGASPVQVDVRVIACSSKDLDVEVAQGRLREDLLHRLRVVPLRIPSLQERREDVGRLFQHFMHKISTQMGYAPRGLTEEALSVLQSYRWPGNVRQLKNLVEWLLIMHSDKQPGDISAEMLPPEIVDGVPSILRSDKTEEMMSLPLREARESFERDYLLAQISRFAGNISRTANFVGMERSALHRKLKLLGVNDKDDVPNDALEEMLAEAS